MSSWSCRVTDLFFWILAFACTSLKRDLIFKKFFFFFSFGLYRLQYQFNAAAIQLICPSFLSFFLSFFPHSLPMEMSHCDNDTACLKFHLRRILLLNSRNLLETSSLVVLASRKSGPNEEWFHATRSLLGQI